MIRLSEKCIPAAELGVQEYSTLETNNKQRKPTAQCIGNVGLGIGLRRAHMEHGGVYTLGKKSGHKRWRKT